MIVKIRKKPVTVEAVQWLGGNHGELESFTGGSFLVLDEEDRQNCEDPEATGSVFDELHSTWVLVYTGQWIIRGVKGEFYPCDDEVLNETYDRVETSLCATAGANVCGRW